MISARYSGDKPGDCSNCFFWDEDRSGCRLGKMNCYYLLERPRVVPTPCDGCPYKKAAPCIGWCTKRILGQEGVNMYAA